MVFYDIYERYNTTRLRTGKGDAKRSNENNAN